MCPLPPSEPVLRVELRLVWLWLRADAFAGATPYFIAEARQHPLEHVREAAFLAVG